MRKRIYFYVMIVALIITIPVVYGYSDPVSLTLIWQFLASMAVGFLIFFKRIKFWYQNKFKKK